MDAPKQYVEELRSQLGLCPTWKPADPIEIGSFGTFVQGVFRKAGRLSDLGIDFTTRVQPTTSDFQRHRGMRFQLHTQASAEAAPLDVGARVELRSRRAYAWAFAAIGARIHEIDDILQVGTAVVQQHRTGLWRREWLLVTEVQHVDLLSVVVARSQDARGSVSARGKVGEPADVLLSADASYDFGSSDVFLVDKARGTTPLFGLRAIRGLFGNFSPIAGGRAVDEETLESANHAPMFPNAG